jgi:upstream-binding transcription factor
MELSKFIAKMYHALSDQKKTKYLEMAKKEKQTYQEKMREFMYVTK